jgi:hypothetical protein
MQPTVSIDRQQMMALESVIRDTVETTKKGVSGAMIQAAVFASQSAAGSVYGKVASGRFRRFGAKNRASKKLKPVKQARDENGKFLKGVSSLGAGGAPWWAVGQVEIYAKGKSKIHYFRTAKTFTKAKLIPRRGLAGNVWRAAGAVKAASIEGFISRALQQSRDTRLVSAYSSNSVSKTGGMISNITMSNSLSYISRVAPNSGREGVFYATKKLRGILDKNLAKKIEQSFQKRISG